MLQPLPPPSLPTLSGHWWANQAATDVQEDLAPSQATILRCQAAANVLAAAGKQATRFKLTAERYYTEHLVMNERIAH